MISIPCLRQCLTSRSASANAFFWRIARASSGRSRAFSVSSSAEAEKTASAEPNTSSRWTAPFGPIPGVRVRAMSGISRFIFRIRQSPNEFGSASFGRNRRFRTRFGASVSGCKDRFLPIKMQSCPEVLQKREIFVYLQTRSRESGSDGRVARQRSAKPCTAVRIRFRPHRNRVADVCNAVFFLFCHTFVIRLYGISSRSLIWSLIDSADLFFD